MFPTKTSGANDGPSLCKFILPFFLQRAIRKSTTFKLYRMPLLPAAYHCDENNSTYKYKHITIVAKKNTEHTHRFKNYVNVVSTNDALQK